MIARVRVLYRRTSLVLALLLTLSSSAFAGDYYVDAVNGSNSNSGTSASDAWQTITHAVASVPGGDQAIHIAAGLYDAALGESFPIPVRVRLALIGAGPAQTILDGGGAAAIISWPSYGAWTAPWAVFEGLWLRNAVRGMDGTGFHFDETYAAYLQDIVISDMSDAGVRAFVSNYITHGTLLMEIEMRGTRIENCGIAAILSVDGTDDVFTDGTLRFIDSEIRDCGTGLVAESLHFIEASAFLDIRRSRLEGISGAAAVGETVDAFDCVVASNGAGVNSYVGGRVRGCTVVSNAGSGVTAGFIHPLSLSDSIVFDNGDDISYPQGFSASYNDIGDGDFAGQNGNISDDPLFVDPLGGDYRLQAGSPCIDAGDPASPRDPDCTRADMGALPFEQFPRTFCTAKVNSCGTQPAIGWSGTPSASAASGFFVHATSTKATKFGLVIYTDAGPAVPATPFLGGLLCLQSPPLKRSVAVGDTTGTPGQCDGTLVIDMNAFAHGTLGGNPLPALVTPGTQVDCQWWARDTIPNGSLLSDALEYVICP